jgi:chromosome condensin MukBEF MukE localization factor
MPQPPAHHAQLRAEYYIPLQQHLSTSFFASLQNNLPFFCCSQQHVFTSLPVSVHVIFDEAPNATLVITIIVVSDSHLLVSSLLHLQFISFAVLRLQRSAERSIERRPLPKPTLDNPSS